MHGERYMTPSNDTKGYVGEYSGFASGGRERQHVVLCGLREFEVPYMQGQIRRVADCLGLGT